MAHPSGQSEVASLVRATTTLGGVAAVVVLLGLGNVSPAMGAATLSVTNNGKDSGTCGATTPCRTISQAIANASAGDKIVVGPGRYGDLNGDGTFTAADGDEVSGDSTKMIIVNKAVTIVSSDGASATILDDPAVGSITMVSIEANGVVFGGKGKGFTITSPQSSVTGLSVGGANSKVTVAGNVARVYNSYSIGMSIGGNGHTIKSNVIESAYYYYYGSLVLSGSSHLVKDNVAQGGSYIATAAGSSNIVLKGNQVAGYNAYSVAAFDLQGSGHVLKGNVATDLQGVREGFYCHNDCGNPTGLQVVGNVVRWASNGFDFESGTGHVLKGNLASGSGSYGFYFGTAMTVTLNGNEATGNGYGMLFNTSVTADVSNNAIVGNSSGIVLDTVGGSFEKNNIYGNDPVNNCGILLQVGGGPVAAQDNYWGAATGPGAKPANQACPGPGSIDTSSFATAPFSVTAPKMP